MDAEDRRQWLASAVDHLTAAARKLAVGTPDALLQAEVDAARALSLIRQAVEFSAESYGRDEFMRDLSSIL